MAAKRKYLWAQIIGTGMNQTILVQSHEVVPFPASTYHKFLLPNGKIAWKNDFGVSDVILSPVEMTEADALR